ncbi:MAG: hypothetical protein ACLP01_01355 [Solirubrobacteraceae bacterium]
MLPGAALAVARRGGQRCAVASIPSQVAGAATVQRRNLVETDTEAGTLSYADQQTVYNRLSGTITWLPAVGQVIKQGQALYKIDARR